MSLSERLTPPQERPRVLVLDIETSPNIAEVWGLWNQNISIKQLRESQRMLCWGARWLGEGPVMFSSEFHHSPDRMRHGIWTLLDEATHVVGWNSARFDIPHVYRELLEHGFPPPRPHVDVDLLRLVRRRFKFPSNKLDYVAGALGVQQKGDPGGHQTWSACLAGSPDAWEQMKRYQMQDVRVTEAVYHALTPWVTNRPNAGAFTLGLTCTDCGSAEVVRDGTHHTAHAAYPLFRCEDCGSQMRHRNSIHTAELRPV